MYRLLALGGAAALVCIGFVLARVTTPAPDSTVPAAAAKTDEQPPAGQAPQSAAPQSEVQARQPSSQPAAPPPLPDRPPAPATRPPMPGGAAMPMLPDNLQPARAPAPPPPTAAEPPRKPIEEQVPVKTISLGERCKLLTVAVDPSGKTAAVTLKDGQGETQLSVVDLETGKELNTCPLPQQREDLGKKVRAAPAPRLLFAVDGTVLTVVDEVTELSTDGYPVKELARVRLLDAGTLKSKKEFSFAMPQVPNSTVSVRFVVQSVVAASGCAASSDRTSLPRCASAGAAWPVESVWGDRSPTAVATVD